MSRNPSVVAIPVLAALVMGAAAWQLSAAEPPKSPEQTKIEELAKEAKQKIKKGNLDGAFADSEAIFKLVPDHALGTLIRGTVMAERGERDAALAELAKIIDKPAQTAADREIRADAYTQKSRVLCQQRKYLPAIDNAYFGLLEKSEHPPAYAARAMAYVGRGLYDKAVWNCDAALKGDKSLAEAHSVRGMAHLAKNNPDQAIKDQTAALGADPNYVYAFQRRAAAYLQKKEPLKAMKDLDDAIKAKPDFVDALCDRAMLYAMAKQQRKSLDDLDEAIRKNPKFARAHVLKGMALLSGKKPDEDGALAAANKAIEADPQYPEGYCLLGQVQNEKREFDAAVQSYTKAIELDPRLTMAYSGRAQVLRKLKKAPEAKADDEMVAKLNPPPAPKKPAEKKKKEEEQTPRFVVTPKGLSPKTMKQALESAREIDRLVEANYAKHNVTPLPAATDEQFLRRVYLDITGTIPTYAQIRRFQQNQSPNRRSELIDELLSSPGYASHFFNYWADVLRYVDQLNNSVRGEPYRQWIKQSLAENKPWDKLVYEMMTAKGLIWENPATGYLQRDPNMPLDSMNNTVRIFLGTRIGCAQCHNHPFDRWTQKEFYQMAAFTFGTVHSTHGGDQRYWSSNPSDRLQELYADIEQEEEDRRNNYYRFERMISVNMQILNDQIERKIQLPHDYAYDDGKPGEVVAPKTLFGKPIELQPGEVPREAFARWLVDKENPRFAVVIANRLWRQVFGVGQIEPVDDMMDETVAENPALMKFLEAEMKRLDFDMKEYLRILFNTQTYQRQTCNEEIPLGAPYHFPGPVLRRMTAEQVWDSFLTLAVTDPEEYRELPATIRSEYTGLDLTKATAQDVLDAERKSSEVDWGLTPKHQKKYIYKGVLLGRASELPSPLPANHFIRMFGQSDREQISTSSTAGSVPQVLFMFNGPITHMLLEKNSTMYNNVVKKKTPAEQVRVIFETVLCREPDEAELELAKDEIKRNGPPGIGNVIWSLVNTREFLFVQ